MRVRDIYWLSTGRGGVFAYLKRSLAEGTIENDVKVSIADYSFIIKLLLVDLLFPYPLLVLDETTALIGNKFDGLNIGGNA